MHLCFIYSKLKAPLLLEIFEKVGTIQPVVLSNIRQHIQIFIESFLILRTKTKISNRKPNFLYVLVYLKGLGIRGHEGAQTPLKTQNLASPPPKRSAHPSRVRRGGLPPPQKIEVIGCANPTPTKNF